MIIVGSKELEEQYKDIYLNQFVKITSAISGTIYYCKIAGVDIIPTTLNYIIKLWCTSRIEIGEIYTTIEIRDSDLDHSYVVFYNSVDNLEKYVKIIDKQDFKDLLKNEVNKLIKTL